MTDLKPIFSNKIKRCFSKILIAFAVFIVTTYFAAGVDSPTKLFLYKEHGILLWLPNSGENRLAYTYAYYDLYGEPCLKTISVGWFVFCSPCSASDRASLFTGKPSKNEWEIKFHLP